MTISAAKLNQVADLLGTRDKNVVFCAVIQFLVKSGLTIDEAFDTVFGKGAYTRVAGQIYDALRAANRGTK